MIKALYPANWPELRAACLERANWQCELCKTTDGAMKWSKRQKRKRRYIVYLHAVHLHNDPGNPQPELIALCPSCHMHFDRQQELAERVSQRRRGYSITTTDTLIAAMASVGLHIEEQPDGYAWFTNDLHGQAETAIEAVTQAIYHLRMAALDVSATDREGANNERPVYAAP